MNSLTVSGCEGPTGTAAAENDPETAGAGDTVTSSAPPGSCGEKHASIVAQVARFRRCHFAVLAGNPINMRRTININRGSRATALTWLGARVVRYSFPVRLLHSLLHAGLSRRYPDQGSAPRILQHYRDWEKYAALRMSECATLAGNLRPEIPKLLPHQATAQRANKRSRLPPRIRLA